MARRPKTHYRRPPTGKCMYCGKTLRGLLGHQKGCQGDLLRRIAVIAGQTPRGKMKLHKYNSRDICTQCGHSRYYLSPRDNGPCLAKAKPRKKAAAKKRTRRSPVAPPVYTPPPDRFDVERF